MPRKLSRIERAPLLVGLLALGLTGSALANPSLGAMNAHRQSYIAAGLIPAADDADDAKPAPTNPVKSPSDTEAPETGTAAEAKTPAGAKSSAATEASVEAMRKAWMKARKQIFAGKKQFIPDSEDPDTVNHLNWYEATGFIRPYPGEAKVRPPSDFKDRFATKHDDDGDGD